MNKTSLTALAAIALAACTAQKPMGAAKVIASIDGSPSLTAIAGVTVSIASPTSGAQINGALTHLGGTWSAVFGDIPIGNDYVITATAKDGAGNPLYTGSTAPNPVTIAAGVTSAVSLLLQQPNPPPNFGDQAPRIDSLLVSNNDVPVSTAITLVATAHDPDTGDKLTAAWTDDGAGVFSLQSTTTDASGEITYAATWTSPSAPATDNLTLTVTDAKGLQASVTVAITTNGSVGSGAASVSITFNNWPRVTSLSSDAGRIDVNGTAHLTAAGFDPDGDPITWSWAIDAASAASGCAGSFTGGSARSAAFKATAADGSGTCVLVATVKDNRGGSGTGLLTLQIGPPPALVSAPAIDAYTQSTERDFTQAPLTFTVTAHDPQGKPLSFVWTFPDGTQNGTQQDTANGSTFNWTPPACDGAAHYVQVDILNGAPGGDTAHKFDVLVCPHTCAEQRLSMLSSTPGFFMLDPDGPGNGAGPLPAYCDFAPSTWPAGADGPLNVTGGANFTLTAGGGHGPGGAYDFSSLHVDATSTLTLAGDGIVVIGVAGDATIDGTIDGTSHNTFAANLTATAPANDGSPAGEPITVHLNQASGGAGGGGSNTYAYGFQGGGGAGGAGGQGGATGSSPSNHYCDPSGGGGGSSTPGQNTGYLGCGSLEGSNGGAAGAFGASGGDGSPFDYNLGYGGTNAAVTQEAAPGMGGGGGGGGAFDYYYPTHSFSCNCRACNCNFFGCNTCCDTCYDQYVDALGTGGGGGGGGGVGLPGQSLYLRIRGALTGTGTVNLGGSAGGAGGVGQGDGYSLGGGGGGGGGGAGGTGGSLILRLPPNADGSAAAIPATLNISVAGGAGGPGGGGGVGYYGPGGDGAAGAGGTSGAVDLRSYE